MSKKTVLITGASSGIGQACAICLSKIQNLELILLGTNEERLNKTQELVSKECKTYQVICDLDSDIDKVRQTTLDLCNIHPNLCAVIHSAGISGPIKLKQIDYKIMQKYQNIHVHSLIEMVNGLIKARSLKLINSHINIIALSSLCAIEPFNFKTPYIVSKAALEATVKGIASELARFDININCLRLGVTDTPILKSLKDSFNTYQEYDTFIKKYSRQSLGIIDLNEVAEFISYLILQGPRHQSGDIISLTSGYYA